MTIAIPATFDSTLDAFEDLPTEGWRTLVLGNGYSINLWHGFRYDALRDEANLTQEADALFRELDTTNFEEVLAAVHHAHLVLEALGQATDDVDDVYEEIRDALFETVRDLHVEWDRFPAPTHTEVAQALDEYDAVFTTNYDLTLYWSFMQELVLGNVRVADLFWGAGNLFDPGRTLVWRGWTALYYLHGAIHLWQDDNGENGKWTYADGGNLLDLARQYSPNSSRRPLFVSESTWQAKRRAIRRSPYLTHCYEKLEDDNANTVVLGHSLSDWDQHIVQAVHQGPTRDIAVSVYPNQPDEDIVQTKARVARALRGHRVHFFDSETHPLGDPALTVR